MVKLLIFDLQGTLVENGVYPSPVKQARNLLGIRQDFHEYVGLFENLLMTKTYNNLSEAFAAVSEGFGVRPSQYSIDKLVGVWNKNRLLSKPYDDIETLRELKADHKLALVANIDCFSKDIIDKFKLSEYFDEIFLSCDIGMLKTDEGFFDTVIKKFKLKASDAVMIGDSIESDIKPSQKAGVHAILMDRHDRMKFDGKITSLSGLKGRLSEL